MLQPASLPFIQRGLLYQQTEDQSFFFSGNSGCSISQHPLLLPLYISTYLIKYCSNYFRRNSLKVFIIFFEIQTIHVNKRKRGGTKTE